MVTLLLGIVITVVPMYYIDKQYSHKTLLPLHITATAVALLTSAVATYVDNDFLWSIAIGSIITNIGYFIVIGVLAWEARHPTE